MLTVLAPAKLNLTLEILAKRQDGFHEVRSVIQTIRLYDRLNFKPGKKMVIKNAENTPTQCRTALAITDHDTVSPRSVPLLKTLLQLTV